MKKVVSSCRHGPWLSVPSLSSSLPHLLPPPSHLASSGFLLLFSASPDFSYLAHKKGSDFYLEKRHGNSHLDNPVQDTQLF